MVAFDPERMRAMVEHLDLARAIRLHPDGRLAVGDIAKDWTQNQLGHPFWIPESTRVIPHDHQSLPPKAHINRVALNPQPLPPRSTVSLGALNPQPLPLVAPLDFVSTARARVRRVLDLELKRAGEIAYSEADAEAGANRDALPVLLLHGYPQTSFMWRHLLPELAASGRRAIAPDLPGYGDSPLSVAGTWESHVEAIERFRSDLGLERVALVVHDWGGLIGMRWACDHPSGVGALAMSGTGFFPDGKWHGLGEALRTPGAGERIVDAIDRDGFAAMLRQTGRGFDDDAIEEYWKAYESEERRRAQLALYRSGDFVKLAPYEGRLATLDIPTLILWGERDTFAPVSGARRFHRQIPHSRLVLVPDAGHFVFEDAPERCAREVVGFLDENGV